MVIAGNWTRLVKVYKEQVILVAARKQGSFAMNSDEFSEDDNLNTLLELIDNNQVGKAIELITKKAGIVDIETKEMLEQVKQLFPADGGTGESIEDVLKEVKHKMAPLIDISHEAVSYGVSKLQHQKATGVDKVTDRSLMGFKQLEREWQEDHKGSIPPEFEVIAQFAQVHAGGYLTLEYYQHLALAKLICLCKPHGGIRPIVLMGREIIFIERILIHGLDMDSKLAPYQYGFKAKNGGPRIVWMIRLERESQYQKFTNMTDDAAFWIGSTGRHKTMNRCYMRGFCSSWFSLAWILRTGSTICCGKRL